MYHSPYHYLHAAPCMLLASWYYTGTQDAYDWISELANTRGNAALYVLGMTARGHCYVLTQLDAIRFPGSRESQSMGGSKLWRRTSGIVIVLRCTVP